jgi:hypothetical protein
MTSLLRREPSIPILLFLCVRLSILLTSTFDGLRGYGDFIHFFNLASLPGLPFLNYWSEFPPLFPFLSKLLYWLAFKQEHVYAYLLIFILTAADLGSICLFERLVRRFDPGSSSWRAILYAALLAGLAYNWWYFDSLAVFFSLLALDLALRDSPSWKTGTVLALGFLTKLFPLLILPAIWLRGGTRRTLRISAWMAALILTVYAALWILSPAYTLASLRSQAAKGSWETVWALIDGNTATGNFGPELERLDPQTASLARGNPARVSPWMTLPLFGGLGIWLLWRAKTRKLAESDFVRFAGITWVIFFLWSPGWSPQWVVYLLPLILLLFPQRIALLLASLFLLVNVLEWPLLLSRGLFSALPLTILLRSFLLVLLVFLWRRDIYTSSVQL